LLSDRLNRLEAALDPSPPAVIGATVAAGRVLQVLDTEGVCRDAPPGLAIKDLPEGCMVHEIAPGTLALLYRSTLDGSPSVQLLGGIDIEIVTGRRKAACEDGSGDLSEREGFNPAGG
jgi:hypothetical protein